MQLAAPPTSLLSNASLFLDLDGTLVELASRPDGIEVGDELLDLLQELQEKLEGRVALVSGRSADDVDRLLHPLKCNIGGSHGHERVLRSGICVFPSRPPGLDEAVSALRKVAAEHPGVHVEDKPAGVAVHYRLAPGAATICREAAERAAMAVGMTLQQGKMVIELIPPGADKGTALRSFMSERPFAGTRPIFIGDDLTDEHGFAAVREFGGAGVLVGATRATAAGYRLEDVRAVRNWLGAACEELQ